MSSSSTCTFPNGRGHDLAARLERPAGAPVGVALFTHCFTCSKDLRVERQLTKALSAQGFVVLSFHFAGLVGHSLGGAAVLSVAPDLPSVRAVATIGAPADPAHVTHLLDGDLDAIRRDGSAPVNIGGRSCTVGRSFLEDLQRHEPLSSSARFRGATLILHAAYVATVVAAWAHRYLDEVYAAPSAVAPDLYEDTGVSAVNSGGLTTPLHA